MKKPNYDGHAKFIVDYYFETVQAKYAERFPEFQLTAISNNIISFYSLPGREYIDGKTNNVVNEVLDFIIRNTSYRFRRYNQHDQPRLNSINKPASKP